MSAPLELTAITSGWSMRYRLQLLTKVWGRAIYKAYRRVWRRRWMAKRARQMMTHRVVATVDSASLAGVFRKVNQDAMAQIQSNNRFGLSQIPDGGYEVRSPNPWAAILAHYGKPPLSGDEIQ